MILDLREHRLTIQRERGDAPARVKTGAVRERHLMDERLPVMRPAAPHGGALPEHNIAVYDEQYMLLSAAEAYNRGERVALRVVPDYWHPRRCG